MSRFRPEPAYRHGTPTRPAVVLVNLGTPDAPTAQALRRYLKEFLSDPRVVEIPRLLWWPLLNGVILNTRPARSAAKYAAVWTPEGSPLRVHTERQAKLLAGLLGARGHHVTVAWGMRYGEPALPAVLDRLKAEGADRILVVPLYPQFAASTTGTVIDRLSGWLAVTRNQPEIRTLRSFADDEGYLAALEASVRRHWQESTPPDERYRLVMSFHGLPRRSLDLGDPYHCECRKTGRLLAERLGLTPDRALVTFQSRFGRAEWLQPYTAPTLEQLARSGIDRVDVICPGFVGDCLETLEEIALEARATFLASGGKTFHYIPALNEQPAWIEALARLVEGHLAGWPTRSREDASALADSARRARDLGAPG